MPADSDPCYRELVEALGNGWESALLAELRAEVAALQAEA